MNEIIVHIGMHKTGSSSIQQSLSNYDDGSTYYADLDFKNHSIPICTAFSTKNHDYHYWKKRNLSKGEIEALSSQYRNQLKDELKKSGRERVIISGEDISHLNPESCKNLVSFLKQYSENIKFVCYVREPLSFAASSFQQRLKGGLNSLPDQISPNYRKRIEKFIDLVGRENVIVRDFSKSSLNNSCVVHDFCELAGVNIDAINVKNTNETLNAPVIKALYHFNRTNPLNYTDEFILKTRSRFVSTLKSIYKDGENIDKLIFSSVSDTTELAYLSSNFGIHFQSVFGRQTEKTLPLDDWLQHIDESHTEPLKNYLEIKGAKRKNIDFTSLIHLLFYQCIQDQLLSNQTDLFKSLAMKYVSKRRVTRGEAIQLMKLALRARPKSKLFQNMLTKW